MTKAVREGLPVVETAIARVAAGRVYYRGLDAVELARGRSLEDVASLLWTGDVDASLFDTPLHVVAGGPSATMLPFLSRAQSMLPLVAAGDDLGFELEPRAVAQTGWRIVNLLASVAAESSELEETVEATLARAWAPEKREAAAFIRAALIASADIGVDAPAYVARCTASTGATPYAVAVAALAAFDSPAHAGAAMQVDVLFDELRDRRDLRRALEERHRRYDEIEGFGDPLFPDGDPRAALLLGMLKKAKELTFARKMIAEGERLSGRKPTLALGLVAAARALGFPAGAAVTLLAIGRTIGWIAHAIEQYAIEGVIEPRVKYVGKRPRK